MEITLINHFGSGSFVICPKDADEISLKDPKQLIKAVDLSELIKKAVLRCAVTNDESEDSSLRKFIDNLAKCCCKEETYQSLQSLLGQSLESMIMDENRIKLSAAIDEIVQDLRSELKFGRRWFERRTQAIQQFITTKHIEEIK